MRTKPIATTVKSRPTRRPRSRFGYDHRWWGEPQPNEGEGSSYWAVTRRPLPCLVFIAPLLAAYEVGVLWLGGQAAESWRAGADAWMRRGLASLGLRDQWLLPLGLLLTLLIRQAADRGAWRFKPRWLLGMVAESLLFAVALIGLSRVVDLGLARLEATPEVLSMGARAAAIAPLIGFLGAGLYEEALFRLVLVPAFYAFARLLLSPPVFATTLAVTASSLLFSLAHHAGNPGEVFTWFVFVFRWLSGIFFAWVFVVRGFGIAVGAHAAYDILVGWFGWHF